MSHGWVFLKQLFSPSVPRPKKPFFVGFSSAFFASSLSSSHHRVRGERLTDSGIPDSLCIIMFGPLDRCDEEHVAGKALTMTLNLIPEKEHELGNRGERKTEYY